MAFTVEDFPDLLRLLAEHPEWRAALRQQVLSEDLLELPAIVRDLAEAQRLTETRVAQLAEAQTRTEQRLDTLTARLDTLTARVDALAAQVEALAARVDALTARVEALAARVDALADQVNSLAVQVTSLAEAQQRTQQQLDTLTLRVESVVEAVALTNRNLANLDAKFRGYELEDRYRRHASGYFGGLLRRMRVHDVAAVVDQYEDRFPREAMLDLLRADMLVHGQVRDAPERGDVWLVVEVSATVDTHDVERAVRRAATLRRASVRALPTVAGEETTPAARERIRADHVVLFRDGGVTGWEDALAAWAE